MKNKKLSVAFIVIFIFLSHTLLGYESKSIEKNNYPELRHIEEFVGEAILQFSTVGPKVLINVNEIPIDNFEFYLKNDSNLTQIDQSKFSTNTLVSSDNPNYNLTHVSYTLNDVRNKIVIKLKNKFTSFKGLFAYSDVYKITLNGFITEEVVTMEMMFLKCVTLTEVKFIGINTSKVQNLYKAFRGCSSLIKLDLSDWDTSSITDIGLMFNGCTALKDLNLISMNIKSITSNSSTYYFLYYIETLNKCAYYEYRSDFARYVHRDCNELFGFYYCGNCSDDEDIYCTKTIDVGSKLDGIISITKRFYYVYEERNYNKMQRSCYYLQLKNDESFIKKESLGIYFKSKCDKTCETCNSIDNGKCEECKTDYYPKEEEANEPEKFCYNELNPPSGYYFSNNVFKKCFFNCVECIKNAYNCTKCKNEIIPSNGKCPQEGSRKVDCYVTCNSCYILGDSVNHLCIECVDDYTLDPSTPGNCIEKCTHFFYIFEAKTFCTDTDQCTQKFSLEISEEKKCVNDCIKENKKQYNAQCLDKCPENTIFDGVCKDNDVQKCFQSKRKSNLTFEEISKKKSQNLMIQNYFKEFNYTLNHISIYENDKKDYRVTIYKNENCLDELNINVSRINIAECLEISGLKNPIFIITENFKGKYILNFSIFNPEELKEIVIEEQCNKTNYTIVKNTQNFITDPQCLHWMKVEKQDVTNIKAKLYTDICYNVELLEKKDMSLNDRIKHCFPEYSICEDNCYTQSVDMKTFKATCKCSVGQKFKKGLVSIIDENGLFTDTNIQLLKCVQAFYTELLSNPAFFIFCGLLITGIVSMFVYFFKKTKTIDIYIKEIDSQIPEYQIQKDKRDKEKEKRNKTVEKKGKKLKLEKVKTERKKLSVQYQKAKKAKIKLQKIKNKKTKEEKGNSKEKRASNKYEPPKKDSTKTIQNNDKKEEEDGKDIALKNKTEINKIKSKKKCCLGSATNLNIDNSDLVSSNYKYQVSPRDSKKIDNSCSKEISSTYFKNNDNSKSIAIKLFTNKNIEKKKKIANNNSNEKILKYDKNKCCGSCVSQKTKMTLDDILNGSFEDMDYWDAIETDKRSLCEMYRHELVQTHQISNLFVENRLIGILPRLFLTVLSFDLCFYINGLYYSEDYISERYQSKEEETILNIVYRSIVRIFIVSILSWIIECLNEFLLPSQNDLIKNVKRILENGDEGGNLDSFREKQKKYILAFFIIGILLEIFALYHMVCVFYHYKYSADDWIVSSLISFFLFNIVSILITFGRIFVRYIAIKCKSHKLYNIAAI